MYLGPDKIMTAVDENNGMVTITLENGTVLKWKKIMFEFCQTKEPSNVTELADSRALKVVQLLVKTLMEVDVKLSELPTVMVRMENFINEKLDAATGRLWRPYMKNDPQDEGASGLQVLQERTISDLDGLLISKNKSDNGQDNNKDTGQSDNPSSEGDRPAAGDTKG